MGKKQKTITFKEWISEQGPSRLAEVLDVQITTVRHWRTGHCLPAVVKMQEIKKRSRGAISYHHIIDGEPFKSGVTI